MAKQTPKYIIAKMNRANNLMQQIVDINFEVEDWLVANGVAEDGFDFFTDCRDSRGYGYEWLDHTIEIINDELGK